ncbi:MAG: NAD(P)/FAD-dependent oxidoreductase [Phycisphaerales bacterium]
MPSPTTSSAAAPIDLAVIGAGAAGLMAAIAAGRAAKAASKRWRIVAFDGAKSLGAKILIAGGGRCNVTHFEVSERDYHGSTPPAIRKVLRRFTVEDTIAFFREFGVELKREDTGKLFPIADDAHVVLDALLRAAREAGVELRHPCRVTGVEPIAEAPSGDGASPRFRLATAAGEFLARRVVLATGGLSFPKTGSDGAGYAFAKACDHTLTPLVTPSLVPLLLAEGHWIRDLSGIAHDAELVLRSGTGKMLARVRGSLLCTHFGLSGPCALDASRSWIHAHRADSGTSLEVNWFPGETIDSIDRLLLETGSRGVLAWLRDRLPDRLAKALLDAAGCDASTKVHQWPKDRRRALATLLAATPLPIVGDRGYAYAEVTAGGVPLAEIDLDSMQSRRTPGLFLCGEICDVDGRIGGFNFQWAWASGFLAGGAAAAN